MTYISSPHPLKQILKATITDWDNNGTPQNVRETFWKIINCGTAALGAEVYESATERRIVYHTCKSRFCPSCGAWAATLWQEEFGAALPDMPYVEINFTMPPVFWPILQQNRHLLNDLPAVGAAAIEFWVKAKYGARVILMVVQQTYGGFLNFYPHLHTLVSASLTASKTRCAISDCLHRVPVREASAALRIPHSYTEPVSNITLLSAVFALLKQEKLR